MTRATDDLLDALHGTVANTLLDEIKRYKNGEVLDPKTELPLPIPASLMAQAIKFLKDNGIDRAVQPGDPEDLLAKELPDFEDNVYQFTGK